MTFSGGSAALFADRYEFCHDKVSCYLIVKELCMKRKAFLSSGEFAALCRTTKATLFHYDQEDLLKPHHVSSGGYRYYDVKQFFDFDTISVLKDTGSSLKEIGQYRKKQDGGHLLEILEEKRILLQQEQARLARREVMLYDMSANLREALSCRYDECTLEELEEESLEVISPAEERSDSLDGCSADFSSYIDFYYGEGEVSRRPFGSILDGSILDGGEYRELYYFKKAGESSPAHAVHVRKAGLYAVTLHKGTEESHRRCLERLSSFIRGEGLSVCGDCYAYDMASFALFGSDGGYAGKYCVRVERAPGGKG